RSSSFSVEQTFWRESDKSQGFGDGVPEAGAGMPLGTVPLSASSTGSGVSPTILPIDSATEPPKHVDCRTRRVSAEDDAPKVRVAGCSQTSTGDNDSQSALVQASSLSVSSTRSGYSAMAITPNIL